MNISSLDAATARRWLRLLIALALVAAALGVVARPAYAATFIVTKTADTNDGTCNADCSLREAIVAANANAGADTITVPAGTYQFTRTGNDDAASVGDLDITDAVTINGAGAGSTIIDGQDADRVFDVAPVVSCTCAVAFSGLTITNGSANATNFNAGGAIYIGFGVNATISNSVISSSSATSTGAGIEARGTSLTLTNVTFQNNDAVASGGALRSIGSLTVSGSSFQNNDAEFGGALALGQDSSRTILISSSTFAGNHTVATAGGNADDGGAIYADIDTTLTLTGNTFTGNSSVNNGGALYFRDNASAGIGTLAASFNRIAGNTAVAGSGMYRESGTATAENNWWGCNAGPSAAPCDRVTGTVDFDPWLVLSHTASPSSVSAGQAATLTASFLANSAGSPIAAGSLGALVGVPVSFSNAVLGTISGAQATIQASGTATATYTAGSSAGAGHADATVDSQTATANITIGGGATTTVTSIDRAAASPTNAGSVSWTITFANAISGLTASNFALSASGLGGAPAIASVAPVGAAPATTWTVTAGTGTGSGSLGLNLANDTGLNYTVNGLPVTGQVYTIDRTAPSVTIDQAAGQADPTDSVPVNFTVVFSEPVNGFTTGAVTLSGTAGATTALVTGSGTTYNVAVSGISHSGTVIASIAAGVATDAAGNSNAASTSTDNTVTVSSAPKWHVYAPLLSSR